MGALFMSYIVYQIIYLSFIFIENHIIKMLNLLRCVDYILKSTINLEKE